MDSMVIIYNPKSLASVNNRDLRDAGGSKNFPAHKISKRMC